MSAGEAAKLAHDAFLNDDYESAVQHFNTAIDRDDTNAEYYVGRAAVRIKLGQFTDALMDTGSAIQLNPNLSSAYVRQGVAYWNLKDFTAANVAFHNAKAHGDTTSALTIWLGKCKAALGAAADIGPASDAPVAMDVSSAGPAVAAATTPVPAPVVVPLSASRIKHDWYQTEKNVVVDIIIKKVQKEDVKVEITPTSLSVSVCLPGGSYYNLELDLCHSIIPGDSHWAALSTKIEITLRKNSLIRWPALEGSGSDGLAGPVVKMQGPSEMAVNPHAHSRKWDTLAADIKREEKEEKPEGDEALNKLFKDIYADASDETRRAMNKSFTESGGTVLSTNWSEIGSQKTECKPPAGAEFKKY